MSLSVRKFNYFAGPFWTIVPLVCEATQSQPKNLTFFKKWATLGLFFIYFQFIPSKQYKVYNKLMLKITIKHLAPGFKLTTF